MCPSNICIPVRRLVPFKPDQTTSMPYSSWYACLCYIQMSPILKPLVWIVYEYDL